jgi:excisionase family DNA binding protein
MVYVHHGQKLLKVSDVALRLQLGKTKVFELLATGELESLKIDGARRVTEEAVDDFILRRQAEARATA